MTRIQPLTGQSFPLTFIQESMFLETQDAANPGVYLEQIVVHLEDEAIDPDAMRTAWIDTFTVHPTLRLSIVSDEDGQLHQKVNPAQAVEITFHDWSDRSKSVAVVDFENWLETDRAQGTAPEQFPNMRFAFIQIGPREARFVWTFHHSLIDGRSIAPVVTEAFRRYENLRDGTGARTPATEPVTLPFADHCRTLHAMDFQPGILHFAKTLAGWEGGSGLLIPDAAHEPRVFATSVLTKAETSALEKLAKSVDVPMSTLCMAAWGVVTARLSGHGDTVFGNTLNGRHLVDGVQDEVGCFITTVPIRLTLSPQQTIRDVLTEMRAQQIALRPFQHTPLAQIRSKTDVPPGVALFDTLVSYETTTFDAQFRAFGGSWKNRGVKMVEEGTTPVTLGVYHDAQLTLTVEYDPGQVPLGRRLARYLKEFLHNLAQCTADTPLAAVNMLNATEIASLYGLSGLEKAQHSVPRHCLSVFETHVARAPTHFAICQKGVPDLSYEKVDLAANRLANLLIAKGVKPGDVVGICTARNPYFVIALLAIWKAGAAFVPMDPSYPKETLSIIEQDSTARLILTDDTAPALEGETLNLSDDPAIKMRSTAPLIAYHPDAPAYVIFTSGSTGRPKGVMVTQASLAAHSKAAKDLYELTPQDHVLQFAALSFDVALEEIIATLLSGASLIMRTAEMAQSTSTFLNSCRQGGITLLNLPTGFWVALTDAMETTGDTLPDTVRMVIVGGERVPLSVLRRWRALVPDVAWVNGYGPTETTITCTAHRLQDDDLTRTSVPIGTPLSHAAAWILTADGALAPEGIEGELWISGPAVAMGYVGQPEITAERFLPARFDDTIGRSYATGDRAVWENKLLSYIGRVDRQIKLRGFRIEPGQIEQVIEGYPDIARAHVAVHTTENTAPRLVVWYSSADQKVRVAPEKLRKRIARALPKHMRPDPVHVVHWPQTPGGKINTPKLPAPTRAATPSNVPDTVAEEMHEIAKLFAKILKIDVAPPHTSFFDLGGDSLLLLRLLAMIEKEKGVRLKPAALYTEPTPAGITKALHSIDTDPMVVIPIQPHGIASPLYAVHVLGDNGSFFRPLAAELGAVQPVFGLTVGLLDEDTPTRVEDIARFYLDQINRHHPLGPVSLIAVSAGSYVTFELAQQLTAAGRDVEAVIFLDSRGPDGRYRISGLRKLFVHAQLFARHPSAYIRRTFTNKREDFKYKFARKKINTHTSETQGVRSVAAFVAANALSIEQYKPTPYPGRLTIVRAGHDMFDTESSRNNGLGWKSVAGGGLEVYDVPGEHLSILQQPFVPELARRIQETLTKASKISS